MTAGRALHRFGFAVAAIVACLWLNQSVGMVAWEKIRDGIASDPSAHVLDAYRFPFITLYRRSGDEAMYYATAAQILGRPYEDDVVARTHARGKVPSWFESPAPSPDGRWHMPWREVHLEYPSLVLPFILAPALVTRDFEPYARLFGLLMALTMLAAIALGIDVVRRAESARSPGERWWLAAGLLLAQGAVTIQRLDPIVALLLALAVHGAARRKTAPLGLFAGLAGACKVVPILVVPVLLAADWGHWRPRVGRLGAWLACGLGLGFVPMELASPSGIPQFFAYHAARGLQIESTLGVLVGAARWLAGVARPATFSYGSFNLDGAWPDLFARLTLPLTLGAITVLVLRARGDRAVADASDPRARVERVTCGALAAVTAIWLCGKVLSPQYLTWGIPLVLAIPGRRGNVAVLGLGLACLLTQVFFTGFYWLVCEQRFVGLVTVVARQAVLVAVLFWAARQIPRPRSAAAAQIQVAPSR